MSLNLKKTKIMHHHFIQMLWVLSAILVSPSFALEGDTNGVKLYKSAVTTAKLHVDPIKEIYQSMDEKEALKISQLAIGKQLGDYTFLSVGGRKVRLSDFRGKPLVIDMIYTHCPFICAIKTRNLDALKLSQDAFGVDSFGVLTIGFDTENDTPEAMDDYGKRMDVKMANWEFVSADADTIKKLSKDLGFVFSPALGGGFDHITQTTFIDKQGKVYQQVYGEAFDNKTLLEPLKNLIYNAKPTDPFYNYETAEAGLAGIAKSVRLFCTIYDAKTGKYTVDYSFFYAIGMGVLVSLLIIWWIVSEYRRSPKRNYPNHV